MRRRKKMASYLDEPEVHFGYWIVLVVVLMLISYVGSHDYIDQQASQDVYCQMVKDKLWPDFKGIESTACTKPP